MTCKIRVLRDFIAVQEVASPENPSKLIEIVRSVDPLKRGTVVAKGTGVLTASGNAHPIEVDLGDMIVFDPRNAVEVVHDNEKYYVLNELSIRAVLLNV